MTLIQLARAFKDYRDYVKKNKTSRNVNVLRTCDLMEMELDKMVDNILYPKTNNETLNFE